MKRIIFGIAFDLLIVYACAWGLVTKYHLNTEIEWTQQLQGMIAHDLEVIAMQKKEIARLRSELPIKVKASVSVKAPKGFTAYRSGNQLILVAPGHGYHHVEIQTDPPSGFGWGRYEEQVSGDTRWWGLTTADTGHFFGVTCEGGSCIPLDVDFVVQEYNAVVRNAETVEQAEPDTPWIFIVVLIVVVLAVVGIVIHHD